MSKTVGLALGGGGARGWAHVGVLRAFQDYNIPVNYVAGTSIGALVGAIYVRDKLSRLEQFAQDISTENLVSLLDISFPGLGLVDGQHIRDFLSDYLVNATLEDCQIPLRCVATNFLKKEEVVFETGSMVDAVRASISMPGIFVPCKHKNAYLVDGGVVNPVPVNVVNAMGAEFIIAVNLNGPSATTASVPGAQGRKPEKESEAGECEASPSVENSSSDSGEESEKAGFAHGLVDHYKSLKSVLKDQLDDWMPDPSTGINIFDVIGNSINIMEQQVTHVRLEIEPPDVLIEPDLMEFGIFDFQQATPMIHRGYEAARAMVPKIKDLLEQ